MGGRAGPGFSDVGMVSGKSITLRIDLVKANKLSIHTNSASPRSGGDRPRGILHRFMYLSILSQSCVY